MARLYFLALAAALAMPASALAAPGTDWTTKVQRSRDGGYLLGNPNAKVKVVEYGSLTCIYCAVFANTDYKIMVARYVTTGKASFEFRYMARDRVDGTAGLLMRCVPSARYFEVLSHLFARQKSWFLNTRSKVAALHLSGKSNGERYRMVAKAAGLDAIFRQYGVSDARQSACLGDEAGMASMNRVSDMAADNYGIEGTPSFLVNGKLITGHDWKALEPRIKKAGG